MESNKEMELTLLRGKLLATYRACLMAMMIFPPFKYMYT